MSWVIVAIIIIGVIVEVCKEGRENGGGAAFGTIVYYIFMAAIIIVLACFGL